MHYETTTTVHFHQLYPEQRDAFLEKIRRRKLAPLAGDVKRLRIPLPYGLCATDSDTHRTIVDISEGVYRALIGKDAVGGER